MLNDEPTEEDQLGRTLYARAFANMIEDCETPLVISINGAWGIGKTTLMKMISKEINSSKAIPVWFNLWEHQYEENPIISLTQILSRNVTGKNKDEIKKLITYIVFALSSSIIKVNTKIDVGYADYNKFKEAYEKDNFQIVDIRIKLKEHLRKLLEYIRFSESNNLRRIIFFIDDLDRCLPDNSLKLLDSLKTFLNIEGCVYFIAMNNEIITKTINDKYGSSGITEKNYLDKIIQFEFIVPQIAPKIMDKYLSLLLPKELETCKDILIDCIGYNPRSIKRFINVLSFSHNIVKQIKIMKYDSRILCLLLVISVLEPEKYKEIIKKCDIEVLKKFCDDDVRLKRIKNDLSNIFPNNEIFKNYVYLASFQNLDLNIINIQPAPSVDGIGGVLKNRYILWVDDAGIQGTCGITDELSAMGVSLSVVTNTEDAEKMVAERIPDLIVSNIGRGNNSSAGLEMAESFKNNGLYNGKYYFFAADLGHGRIARADKLGAQIFTEKKPLIKEISEYLQLNKMATRG